MPFHRFQDPDYSLLGGSFPGAIGAETYDRINVVDGGVGGGDGSANADGPKATGPNAGTYFVAFGEDATSSAANRGLRALAQNTDALDNILRGSIPYVTRVQVTQLVDSVDVAVTGDVFVGELGLANTQESRNKLVYIERADGTPYTVNGTVPTCTLIHDGSAANVVGTAPDGFRSGATIRLSAQVTEGTYTVFIARRSSYANLFEAKKSDIIGEHILGRAFDSELWKSFSHGLDGKYRKSTQRLGAPDGTDLNVAGAGAEITRDGKALTVYLQSRDWEGTPSTLDDPLRAGILAAAEPTWWDTVSATSHDSAVSGHIGYAFIANRKSTQTGTEAGPAAREAAAFAVFNPVNLQATAVGGDPYYTYLEAAAEGVLNPSGLGGNLVRVTAPYRFSTSGNTGLLLGYDLLLVEALISGVLTRRPYVLEELYDDLTVRVSALGADGGAAALTFPANTACTVTWLQTSTLLGGTAPGHNWGGSAPGARWPNMLWVSTNRNRLEEPGQGCVDLNPQFIARKTGLVWQAGWHDPLTGTAELPLAIQGNGNILQTKGLVTGSYKYRHGQVPAHVDTTYNFDLYEAKSSILFICEASAGDPVTLTLTMNTADADVWNVAAGDTWNFYLYNGNGADITLDVPSAWTFSDGDDVIPLTAGCFYKFTCHRISDAAPGTAVLVTRTDYLGS